MFVGCAPHILRPLGPAAPTTSAWNPASKNAGVTLSNSNQRATYASGSGWEGVRSTLGRTIPTDGSVGYKVEFKIDHITATNAFAGLGKSTVSLMDNPFASGAPIFCGFRFDGYVYDCNSNGYGQISLAVGDIVGFFVYYNTDNGRSEFRLYQNGTQMFSGIPAPDGAAIFPMFSGYGVGDSVSLNTGSTPFASSTLGTPWG